MEFEDGKTGHADLHPYPEKGEKDLHFYLNSLKQKNSTFPLCQRALAIARIEAKAQNQNLLSHLNIPQSHYLITELTHFCSLDKPLAQGFKIFKVKLSHPLKEQTEILLHLIKRGGSYVKWRIDFHNNLSQAQWALWQKESLPWLPPENIDFIEAPFLRGSVGEVSPTLKNKDPHQDQKIAWDVWSGDRKGPGHALVLKSSRIDPKDLFKKPLVFKRVIFTHTLAHPLDQISSAYFASQFYKITPRSQEICGLVQTDVYEKSSWTLPYQGPFFPRLSGPGWGLSHLLNPLPWKKLF